MATLDQIIEETKANSEVQDYNKQTLDDVDRGVAILNNNPNAGDKPKLPPSSAEQRILASLLYTGEPNKQQSYLNALGVAGDPGQFWKQPNMLSRLRELGIDTGETVIGQGAKFVGQVGGEALGADIGGSLGAGAGASIGAATGSLPGAITGGSIGAGIGGVTGFAGGGAAGRSLVQLAAEKYAQARGMPIDKSRVGAEAAAGGLTSLGGQALSAVAKGLNIGKQALLNTRLGKKWDQFALENITIMPRAMQKWINSRWTEITNLAKTPEEAFSKFYDKSKSALDTLFGKQDKLGRAITQAKNDLLYAPGNKPAMQGLGKSVADAVAKYRPNIKSSEAALMTRSANILERLGGDVIEKAPSAADVAKAVSAGTLTEEQAVLIVTREQYEALYNKALDSIVTIGRKAKTQESSALGNLAKEVNSLINGHVTNTGPFSTLTKQLDDLGSILSEANLKDPVKRDAAMKWLQENLFDEESLAGNQAFSDALTKYLGRDVLDNIKDLATAYFARKSKMLASFGKMTIIPAIGTAVGSTLGGGLLGGGIGAVAGGGEGAKKGAAIGGTLGLGMSAPYVTPGFATLAHRFMEAPVNQTLLKILRFVPKFGATPLATTITNLSDSFGITPTAEDLKVLKSRSKALSTP